ncbi:divergent polysaccharide deacetylase family protein [Ruegeria arenilitoris]|uniref:divergent polysaccharide deacetylase family protein n=1 Tax=Ruegeria arenilitoris TaxID=1173585 RepID=UPI001481153B
MSTATDGARAIEAINKARGMLAMRGFYGGMFAGAVSVLALATVASLYTPLTTKPEVSIVAPKASEAPTPSEDADLQIQGKDADLVELAPKAPDDPETQSDTLAGLSGIELQPDTRPTTGSSPSSPQAPDAPAAQPVTVDSDTPASMPNPAPTPTSPELDTDLEIAAENLLPPEQKPEVATEPDLTTSSAQLTPEAQIPVIEEPEEQSVQAPLSKEPEASGEQVAAVQPDDTPQPEAQTPKVEEDIAVDENPIAVEGEEDTLPRNQPRIISLPQISPEQPSGTRVGKRIVPLTERDQATEEQAEVQTLAPGKPIEEYAVAFENPEAKPLMSIILIDDEGAFGAEALKDFPYPLSLAVNPSDPKAAEKMARHREAGFEVLALIDMHTAASAQDAEVSLAVWLEALPETVGLLEGVGTGIQGNRKLADQVAAIAGDTGRGLVTQDSGLNTVQKLAARNGVPSSVVFRDFDGASQDAQVIRRFLDQAAFRASQQGAVVMLGRLRPETISALLLWGLEDRGNRVAMAPISAVMMSEVQRNSGSAEY